MEQLRSLIEHMVRGLVDQPDHVRVLASPEESVINFTVWVDEDDVGKALGKEGRIVTAMRTIVHAVGRKYRLKVHLEVLGSGNRSKALDAVGLMLANVA